MRSTQLSNATPSIRINEDPTRLASKTGMQKLRVVRNPSRPTGLPFGSFTGISIPFKFHPSCLTLPCPGGAHYQLPRLKNCDTCQEHGIFQTFSLLFARLSMLFYPLHVLFAQSHSSKKRRYACYKPHDVAEHNVQLQWTTRFQRYLRGLASR